MVRWYSSITKSERSSNNTMETVSIPAYEKRGTNAKTAKAETAFYKRKFSLLNFSSQSWINHAGIFLLLLLAVIQIRFRVMKRPMEGLKVGAENNLLGELDSNKLTSFSCVSIAPLISISEKAVPGQYNHAQRNLIVYCSVCPNEEAKWDLLSVCHHMIIKNLIVHSINSVRRFHPSEVLFPNIDNAMISSVRESKKLVPKINTAFMQAFIWRKQQSRNFFPASGLQRYIRTTW